MEFVILVALWYMACWLHCNAESVTKQLGLNSDIRAFIVWGYFSSLIKGTTIGYTLWFTYYCIKNYPYDLI